MKIVQVEICEESEHKSEELDSHHIQLQKTGTPHKQILIAFTSEIRVCTYNTYTLAASALDGSFCCCFVAFRDRISYKSLD